MKVYNDTKIKHMILNPDEYYHNYDIHSKLYAFYKSFQAPDDVDSIIGIHIRYEIKAYPYEMHADMYQEISSQVSEVIQDHIHYENAYMYFDKSNDFYIVMFDEEENRLCSTIKKLYEDIKKYQFSYHETSCFIHIKTGIYYASKNVNPYYLYEASQNILEASLKHHQAYISIYHSFN